MQLSSLNFLLVLGSCWIAVWERRFDHQQMGRRAVPCGYHGGIWADLVFITMICHWADPYCQQWSMSAIVWCVIITTIASVIAHVIYCTTAPIPGHIVDTTQHGLKRMTLGGWYHALYFVWAFTIVLLYFLASPGAPRFYPCLALTGFIGLAVLQPGWYAHKVYEGDGRIDWLGWVQTTVLLALLWGAGYTRP